MRLRYETQLDRLGCKIDPPLSHGGVVIGIEEEEYGAHASAEFNTGDQTVEGLRVAVPPDHAPGGSV